MNKIFFAALGFAIVSGASAQTSYDAYKFSKNDPVAGNARYAAMGGAMGALGADLSASKDNPAGLGVYSKCDISITPNIFFNSDGDAGMNVNNFGFALNFGNSGNKTGYVNSTLALTYNRLNTFKRNTSFYERDHYMSDATINEKFQEVITEDETALIESIENYGGFDEKGNIGEWDVSYGMNISNRIYWGAGIGFTSIDYQANSNNNTKYFEKNDIYSSTMYDDYYEMRAYGFNVKVGLIGRFTDWFRAGVSFHSPTFYYDMEEYVDTHIDVRTFYSGGDRYEDEGEYKWNLQTPIKLNLNLGFVVAKRAVVGVDYGFQNMKWMKVSDVRGHWGDNQLYEDAENSIIDNFYKPIHTLKVGTEVVVTKQFFARAGFAYETSGVDLDKKTIIRDIPADYMYPNVKPGEDPSNTLVNHESAQSASVSFDRESMQFGLGVGFRGKFFYSDVAFVHKMQKNALYDYLPSEKPTSEETLHVNNIMATFGFKF